MLVGRTTCSPKSVLMNKKRFRHYKIAFVTKRVEESICRMQVECL